MRSSLDLKYSSAVNEVSASTTTHRESTKNHRQNHSALTRGTGSRLTDYGEVPTRCTRVESLKIMPKELVTSNV